MRNVMLALVLLLVGCASPTPMTEYERLAHEADRVEKYLQWHESCLSLHLTILTLSRNMRPRCPTKGICVPPKWSWNFYYLKGRVDRLPGSVDWRPSAGNDVMCGRWVF